MMNELPNFPDEPDEATTDVGSYDVHHDHIDSSGNDSFEDNESAHLVSQISTPEGSSGWFGSIFLIVNAALGAGLLDFPEAFDQAGGILISMMMQAFLLTFAVMSLLILAYCAQKHSCSTYQEVMLRTCGRRMERVCSTVIALYCYGTCITFIVIIGDLSDRSLSSLYGTSYCHQWYMTREFVMTVVSIAFILPLCFPKQIDFLKYPSSLGVIAVFYIVGLIIYEYFRGGFPTPKEIKTVPDHWEDVLTVVPVICFGYQCHVSSVPIYACMNDKRVSTFSRSILSAIVICGIVYSMAGIYGYLTFGSDVASDILLAYDGKNPIVLIGLIALGLKIITTYPILMFCGRLALEDLSPKALQPQSQKGRFTRRLLLSFAWFLTTLLAACVVPNINVAISCIGSMAALFIFVFPAFALLRTKILVDRDYILNETRLVILYSLLSVGIGMFVFGQVLAKSIFNIITGSDNKSSVVLCT